MARQFDIPVIYRSQIISKIKLERKLKDKYKKDFSPSILDLGEIIIKISRHFGFCYGVENAIDIAYKALEDAKNNSHKKIYLLSEMIHNPTVNEDLKRRGMNFLRKTDGTQLIPLSEVKKNDIVIIPAFGTTLEIISELKQLGIEIHEYNTTCPFVERVWNKAEELGKQGYTIIIHGHDQHEETRATFSHSACRTPTLTIRNKEEAYVLCEYIKNKNDIFYDTFKGRYSKDFNINKDLQKIAIVNQTTMLASETKEIGSLLKQAILSTLPIISKKDGSEDNHDDTKKYFADTRDTLCYATSENQEATKALLSHKDDVELSAKVAIVVGGYNSSNTSHIVELLEEKIKTFYIKDASEILDNNTIRHFDLHTNSIQLSSNWLPQITKPIFLITAGASCPDTQVDEVIRRIASFYLLPETLENILQNLYPN